ncbi:CGNR zinc finger domain-containing protein [Actinoplanes regularis]|uniref:CGNR zinc finger domain-containing protein n=1 Tax=Actinoplanes regularis TaxID=52697 RepID=UPI00249FA69D|nr:ABATE domain-containing protein [Actinoplanes regularis]GLW30605.1 hypothetical protein Areg01_35450 [Actinoplanes regularis]
MSDFRFLGGRLSVNFTATLGLRWREPGVERLATPTDLARWFVEAGVTDRHTATGPEDLSDAHHLREAIYRLARTRLGHGHPDDADLALVNLWAARRPAPISLRPTPDGLAARLDEPTPPGLLALIGRDAVDLLGGPEAARLRECAGPECSLLYIDTSRAGNRRWCSMDSCGSRDKMTRYRRRTTG